MRHVNTFISNLADFSARKEAVNIVDWFNFTTFDITSELVFGKPLGCLATGSYHPGSLAYSRDEAYCTKLGGVHGSGSRQGHFLVHTEVRGR